MPVKTIENKIYLGGEITEDLCSDFFAQFSKLELTQPEIWCIMHGSMGGNFATAGSPMMDLVLGSHRHIYMVGMGEICSSAALLWLCGDTRYLSNRSLLMFHKGSVPVEEIDAGEFSKMSDIIEQQHQQDISFLVERSLKGPKFWEDKLKSDYYIFPDEAIRLGLCHYLEN